MYHNDVTALIKSITFVYFDDPIIY